MRRVCGAPRANARHRGCVSVVQTTIQRPYSATSKDTTISFTKDESKIITFLNEVNNHYKLGNTIRIAGGWVRNKLLGKPGGDMDIALDKMTGATFCNHLRDYQMMHGLEKRRVAVIRANPAQSKHLETATTTIFNQTLDFVHLRSEIYAPDSRIPQVVFGTPKEDAERRDFTVNSLYYNASESKIEDFTTRGVTDLKDRILRTPLEPLRTLLDDPLRALRCVRFVGQLGFEPAPDLLQALHDRSVQNALQNKVSRERVNVELTKLCISPAMFRAFELLTQTGLVNQIYNIGFSDWQKCLESLQSLSSIPLDNLPPDQRVDAVNAAFLWPAFEQLKLSSQYTSDIFVLSLHGSKRHGNAVAQILDSARAVLPFLQSGSQHWLREDLASWLRSAPADMWKLSVTLAGKTNPLLGSLLSAMEALNPAVVRATRPLLNGTEIADLLKLPPGPQRGAASSALMRWQLANPSAGRHEATQWLQAQQFYSTLATPSRRSYSSSTADSSSGSSMTTHRRSYEMGKLSEQDVPDAPGLLFSKWYAEASLNSPPPLEVNAMSLCTVNKDGAPSARTVLLRDFDQDETCFSFYGNGNTRKGRDMDENPRVALIFYWPMLERQVRVSGTVERLPKEKSSAVFATRPRESQIGAWASPNTGKHLNDRMELEDSARDAEERFKNKETVEAPEHWSGWRVRAETIEFFQGRPGRLHDRFLFQRLDGNSWKRERIAP